MKTQFIRKIAVLSAGIALLAEIPTTFAEPFTSTPAARWEIPIRGGGRTTILGLNLIEAPAYSGPVSGVSDVVLTIAENLTNKLTTGRTYAAVVATGTHAGVNTPVVQWTANTVTLSESIEGLIAPGQDTLLLIALPTISEIFGVGGDVLVGGTAATADRVRVKDSSGSENFTIYYSTGGIVGTGWRAIGQGAQNFGTQAIYLTDAVAVEKLSEGDALLETGGFVIDFPVITPVASGSQRFATLFADGTTLATSGLFRDGVPEGSLTPGSATSADIVILDSDGDGVSESYFYSPGGLLGTGWRRVGDGNQGMDNISLTSGFTIQNRSGLKDILRSPAY